MSTQQSRSQKPARSIRELQRTLSALATGKRPEDAVRARARVLLSYLAHVPIPILIVIYLLFH